MAFLLAGFISTFTTPRTSTTFAKTLSRLKKSIQYNEYRNNLTLEVSFKQHTEYTIPEELQQKFNEIPALKPVFEALTPGRQRGYMLHFSAPKQSKTRETRVEKYIPKILNGKGIDD